MERVEPIDVSSLVAVRVRGSGWLNPPIRLATFRQALVFGDTAPLNACYNITLHELDRGSGDSDGCDGEECREEVSGKQHAKSGGGADGRVKDV